MSKNRQLIEQLFERIESLEDAVDFLLEDENEVPFEEDEDEDE